MATPSVITALAPNMDEMVLGALPYDLQIKGQPEPRVAVTELTNVDTGKKMIRIIAHASEGIPVQPLSTLDAIARRILPNARVAVRKAGAARMFRLYEVPTAE